MGGMETTGKLYQVEVTENSFFIVDELLDVPPEHTQFLPAAMMLPKDSSG
jgi:hypothetical protein